MSGNLGGRGILISFDGLDSTGKETQTVKLADFLQTKDLVVKQFRTPDYGTASGQELKLRLQNKLGNWNDTPWRDKMAYFAANRAEHRPEVVEALTGGEIVIYDRYVPSSLAFISVEAGEEVKRAEVYDAVRDLEYGQNQMPTEDVSIFLDVHPSISMKLLKIRKMKRADLDEYTDLLHVQERLYQEYVDLCQQNPEHFIRIPCIEGGSLLDIETVAEKVRAAVQQKFSILDK